jgi:hypothetical protein
MTAPANVFTGLVQLATTDDGSGNLYAISNTGAIVSFGERGGYLECHAGYSGQHCLEASDGSHIPLVQGFGLATYVNLVLAIGSPFTSFITDTINGGVYAFTRIPY